ncbi:MAG: UbiD family decarboxylase [Phycisphaerales bacterium]
MRTLSDLISLLEREGELVRVRARVSPILEIAAIADRLSKCPAPHAPSAAAQATDPRFHRLGGPAVLFENVEGSDIPVLINAFGSYRRMELVLGRSFQDVADRIAALVKPQPPRSLAEAFAKARQFLPLLKIAPKRNRRALHHDTVLTGDAIDLTRLPIIRCWPLDGDLAGVNWPADINANIPGLSHGPDWDATHRGRYITLAGVHTIHADDRDSPKPASHNIGMYRVQLLGPRTLAMHWHMHHDGAAHWRSWKKLGQPMPVAIVLGAEPILPYAATAPLPPGISELLMAGFLNRGGIPLARAKTVPLHIPGNAEIVIEGFASHDAGPIGFTPPKQHPALGTQHSPGPGAVVEGPFGDHTGFYSLPDRYPIVTVTAVTMRAKPIYPTTVVGLPPQEDYILGKATERIMLPLLKTLIHDIEDYDLPMFGAFHNCAFIKIKKQYPLHARRVMHAVWGAGQMSWTKCIFVVDHDVDVHDHHAVLAAASKHCAPARDIERVRGPLDILDHASPHLGAGTKIGFDCTPRLGGEQAGRPDLTPATRHDPAIARLLLDLPHILGATIHDNLPGWCLVRADRAFDEPEAAGRGRVVADSIASAFRDASARDPNFAAALPPFVILLGRDADLSKPDDCLFHWLANSDPGRDATTVDCPPHSCIIFDATPKGSPADAANNEPCRPWPPVLRVDQPTRDLIDRRWSEYGLAAFQPAL